MNIRAYNVSDWDRVESIYTRAKPDEMVGIMPVPEIIPLGQDEPMKKLFDESSIFLFEEDCLIKGFAGFKDQSVNWMFVDPLYRKQGIADNLLRYMLDAMSGEIKLSVSALNTNAVNLYKKNGFEVAREFQGKYNDVPVPIMILFKKID